MFVEVNKLLVVNFDDGKTVMVVHDDEGNQPEQIVVHDVVEV